jgi:hypothetical protein
MIEPGSPAPDFTLPNQDGESVKLSDLRDQWVVSTSTPRPTRRGETHISSPAEPIQVARALGWAGGSESNSSCSRTSRSKLRGYVLGSWIWMPFKRRP